MKNNKFKFVLIALIMLVSFSSFSKPKEAGWEFSCNGTTGQATDGNGNWITWVDHPDCA